MNKKTNDLHDVFRKSVWLGGAPRGLLPPLALPLPFPTLAADTNSARKVHFLEPHQTRYTLVEPALTNGNLPARPAVVAKPAWTKARLEGSTNTVELGSRLVLQLAPGKDPAPLLARHGLLLSRTVT